MDFIRTSPKKWTSEQWQQLAAMFEVQNAPVYDSIGGFFNPTVEDEDAQEITFRCFYHGYDNEDDSWHFTLDRQTGRFDS